MYLDDIKMTLLGNSGVGKTGIIKRFVNETFKDNNSSTIGANSLIKIIKHKNNKYRLNIWDTAGQEKYQSLSKLFYRDAYIIVLVYDLTNKKSFDSLKENWYPDIKSSAENCVLLGVVGNKLDLFEEDNTVDENEAKEFANEINAIFSLVSAKEGDNVSNFFDNLMKKFFEDDVQEKVRSIERKRGFNSSFSISEQKKGKKHKICCK